MQERGEGTGKGKALNRNTREWQGGGGTRRTQDTKTGTHTLSRRKAGENRIQPDRRENRTTKGTATSKDRRHDTGTGDGKQSHRKDHTIRKNTHPSSHTHITTRHDKPDNTQTQMPDSPGDEPTRHRLTPH
jgi:hypothetical protein